MSMFGAFMNDIEDDPFFGAHMRSMREMNSMFDMFPFSFMGSMSGNPFASAGNVHQSLMPLGFPGSNMNMMLLDYENLGRNNPNAHTFSSSSVVTMSRGPDGQPQVYQASTSTRSAPGGVKETKKLVSDSRSGVKKMAVGHHIGERAHILEREHNYRSGQSEQRQDFINIDEDEAEDFNREFEEKVRRSNSSGRAVLPSRPGRRLQIRDVTHDSSPSGSTSLKSRRSYSTLPAPTSTSSKSRRSYPALPASSSSSQADEPDHPQSRKRDHEPGSERSSKALKPSHETSM